MEIKTSEKFWKSSKSINAITIDLTDDELEKLTRPVNGIGGRQDLMRDISAAIKKRKRTLTLDRNLAVKLVHFKDYGKSGGFQSRISDKVTDSARSLIMKNQLLDKSMEAYLLCLEIINKPTIVYRIETFAYLICNAWEMLLKAKLLQDNKTISILYKKKNGWSKGLSECRNEMFPDESNPIRLNLKDMGDFRNECTHLSIGIIPSVLLGISQTCITNYHMMLGEWFGLTLADRISPGMMTLIMNFDPQDFDPENSAIRSKLSKDAINYLIQFQHNVLSNLAMLDAEKAKYYCVPIIHTIAQADKVNNADIKVGSGITDPTHEIIVKDDSDKTHPILMKELRKAIRERTNNHVVLTSWQLKCILYTMRAKNGGEYFLRKTLPNAPYQYTRGFVEYLVNKINADPDYVKACQDEGRLHYRNLSLM